jgi:hypothetical protein
MADQERLQRDLATSGERLRVEHEADLRRVRLEAAADSVKYKDAAERSTAELARLRAVCGALERQLAAGRAQNEELKRSAVEYEKAQERFKAEFVVLQRKWVERETEIRAEAAAQSMQMLESEKARVNKAAQEELNQRAARLAEQMEKGQESELRRREAALRIEIERETLERFETSEAERQQARLALEAGIGRLRGEMARQDTEWGRKFLAKETELVNAQGQAADLASRRERAEELHREDAARLLELDQALQAAREEEVSLRRALGEVKERLKQEESRGQALQAEKEKLERLAAAQSAQVKVVEESLKRQREEIAKLMEPGKGRDDKAP